MTNLENKIRILNLQFEFINSHFNSVCVFKNQMKSFQKYILQIKDKILNCNFDNTFLPYITIVAHLDTIKNVLWNFDLLLQLYSENSWPIISLSLPVSYFFNETELVVKILKEEAEVLKLNVDNFEFSVNNIKSDLDHVYNIFNSTKVQNLKVSNQLQEIKSLYLHFKLNEPTSSPELSEDLLEKAKDWELNLNDISNDLQIVMGTQQLTMNKTTTISDNKEIYLLKMVVTDNLALERAEKELMLLSTLRHPNIAEFVGGSIKNGITYAFNCAPNSTLGNLLRQGKGASPLEYTKIAYGIAKGMCYLHQNKILHGNLNPNSIILQKKFQPQIWNFGFSSNSPNLINMPPEYMKKGIYSYESDVYQYGLLLWEIGMKKRPFAMSNFENLKIDLVQKHVRPLLDDTFTPEMKKLIEDCWSQDPDERPTFAQILKRFEKGTIYFSNSNLERIEKYFNKMRTNRWKQENLSKIPELKDIFSSFSGLKNHEEKISAITKFLNDNSKIYLLKEVIDQGVIEKFTHVFEKSKKKKELLPLLIKLFQNNQYGKYAITSFIDAGGNNIINSLLEDSHGKEIGYTIIKTILHDISKETALELLPNILNAKKYKLCIKLCKIAGKDSVQIIGKNIPMLIESLKEHKRKEKISHLVQFYLKNTSDDEFIKTITVKDAITIGDILLLKQLMLSNEFLSSFKNDQVMFLFKVLTEGKIEQKQCAVLFILSLDPEFYLIVSRFPKLIDAVLNIEDDNLIGRFLVRVTRFQIACDYIISKHELFKSKFDNSWYLTALSRIAGYYPNKVAEFSFLKEKLVENLTNYKCIEATTRLLGTLSRVRSLWQDLALVKLLYQLLRSQIATPLETTLVLAVLSNVAAFVQMSDYFLQLLSIAESNNLISGYALNVISMVKLPTKQSRELNRLLILLKYSLNNGDDNAKIACSRIIQQLANVSMFRELFQNQKFDELIYNSSSNENDPFVFLSLMHALDKLEVQPSPEILTLFDNMQTKIIDGSVLPDDYIQLKNKMRLKAKW